MINKPELLVPVGDMERLDYALNYGADAIYLGGEEFGMRAGPANFNLENLKVAVDAAHAKGIKVYLTCNTLPTSAEIDRLPEYLVDVEKTGIDAIIVADMGVLDIVKSTVPNLDIHMSTQTGIVNYATANMLYKLGAKRVVLAREMSFEQIKIIREKTPPELEIECFVHGAMCVSFSGRCLLSQYITGRDANRGECAQPCRWGYHLMEEKRPGEYYPIFEDEQGTYIMNAKDMCMIEHIDKLVEAGITSLKIEGRAKSFYYVAVAANAYRMAIDNYLEDPNNFNCPDWLKEEVCKISHRQYTTGFYFGRPEDGQYLGSSGYVRNWDVCATVEDWADGIATCQLRGKFAVGDTVEIVSPSKTPFEVIVQWLENDKGERVENVPHPMMIFKMPIDKPVSKGDLIRKER